MGWSLAFHIVFAVIGMAMPVMMVMSEWRWLRTGDAACLDLTRRWAKGTAIFFAVGAVSGTVLSFELGLLWPGFMGFAGSVIGMPFSLEGSRSFSKRSSSASISMAGIASARACTSSRVSSWP
jgi:cytochrome d ubiquinol oxidase subunit I